MTSLAPPERDLNVPLLRKVWEQIALHPETWYQPTYRCATGMCVAGWACELSGGEWAYRSDQAGLSSMLVPEPGDPADALFHLADRLLVHADARAQRLLGLDDDQAGTLFDGANDLDAVRATISTLIREELL